MDKYFSELNDFLSSSIGEITFERKPNGDVLITRRETILVKEKNKSSIFLVQSKKLP